MITAGIDAGNKFTKVIFLKNNEVVGCGRHPSKFDHRRSALNAFNQALDAAGLKIEDVSLIIATGVGKSNTTIADDTINEITAAAKGAANLFADARTVIDVGAEEGRALSMGEGGKITDFAVNEKCASGAGSFVEMISSALEVSLEEMGQLSLKSAKSVPINAQCAVFAESEVISLIHARTPKEDISRAVLEALASRISSLARRAGLKQKVILIGGLAKNPGFVRALENDLGTEILLPDHPEFVSALGAALVAEEKAKKAG